MFNILVKAISIVTALSIFYYFDESGKVEKLERESVPYDLNSTVLSQFPLKDSLCCDYACRSKSSLLNR